MAAAGHRQKASDADQARRWRKLVFDVQTLKCEVSALTVDETRAMAADINARWAALQRQWEASGDLHALLGGLIFLTAATARVALQWPDAEPPATAQ